MAEDLTMLMTDEVVSAVKELSNLEVGSTEYSQAVDDICKLNRQIIDDKKMRFDQKLQEQKLNDDYSKAYSEQKIQMRNNIVRWAIDIAGIIVPITFYGIWMDRGFKFEQEGTYTSTTFRNLFNRFKPTEVK